MSRWLIAAVLLVPLSINPFGMAATVSQAKNNLLIHLGLWIAAWSVRSWWLRAVIALTWLSFLINGMAGHFMVGMLGVIVWALFFDQATRLSDAQWRSVCVAVTLAAYVQLGWMLLQAAGHDPLFVAIANPGQGAEHVSPTTPVPVIGWLGNSSDLALFFALSLPPVFMVHPGFTLPLVVAILFLRSTAGLLCVVMLGLWMLARWDRAVALVGASLMALGAMAYLLWVDPAGTEWRPSAWRAALALIWQRPWGYGINSLDYSVILDSSVGRWNFLQNEWIQFGLEVGVLGPLLAGAYLVRLFWRMVPAWRQLHSLAPAVLMVSAVSLFSIPFRVGPVALLVALQLGRTDALLARH